MLLPVAHGLLDELEESKSISFIDLKQTIIMAVKTELLDCGVDLLPLGRL